MQITPRLVLFVTIAVVASGCLSSGPTDRADGVEPSFPLAPEELPAFIQRSIGFWSAAEPMVVFTPSGAAFYSAAHLQLNAEARPSVASTHVLRSRDDGRTWQEVTPIDPTFPNQYITGDPYLHVVASTGRLFSVDYVPVPGQGGQPYQNCNVVQRSDDEGESWARSLVCPWADHQTLFSGPPALADALLAYPSIVYLCGYSDRAPECRTSLDGGVTFGDPVATFAPGCGPETGHGVVAPDGTAYIARQTCELPGWDGGSGDYPEGNVEVAISRDNGRTWKVTVIAQTAPWPVVDGIGQHEVRLAADKGGNVYAAWVDHDFRVWFSHGADQGRTWDLPQNITEPSVLEVNGGLVGVIAGADGHVAVTFVGTPDERDPGSESDNRRWNQYVATSVDALEPVAPFVYTTTNDPADPIRVGSCYDRCYGDAEASNFAMMDFINIEINPVTGAVWTSLVDLCTDACADGGDNVAPDPNQAAVGIQLGGLSLWGTPLEA